MCKQAAEDLWDSILIYSYLNIDHIVESLQRSFANNRTTFDDLVTKMFGVCDPNERGSRVDRELGDLIISLHHAVSCYDKSMKQLHALIHFASGMIKSIDHVQDRLRYLLLKAKFASELHELICTLGFPERAFGTFVRAAKTSPTFKRLQIYLVPSSSSLKRVHVAASTSNSTSRPTTPTKPAIKPTFNRMNIMPTGNPPSSSSTITTAMVRTSPPKPPVQPQRSAAQQAQKTPGRTASTISHPKSSPTQQNDIMLTIRLYLARDDQTLDLSRLQPAAKQDTARLAVAVLCGQLLPISTNAWYMFGFVATLTEEEERNLGGLYLGILRDAQNPQSIFRDIMQAVQTNTLVDLINTKEYGRFQDIFPGPASFLTTPPEERTTVWRLKQFINDEDNTSPPPHLQRDYGFRYCRQREEVQRLKEIYWNVLKKVDPMDLHNACVHGRLYELASMRGLATTGDRRLMQNDYPAQYLGVENGDGLKAYCGPFFRRR